MKADAIRPDEPPRLSPRELECLQLARNRTSKDIGRELGISPYTVDQHIASATRKLGAPNRRTAFRLIVEAEQNQDEREPLRYAQSTWGEGTVVEDYRPRASDDPPYMSECSRRELTQEPDFGLRRSQLYKSMIGTEAPPLIRLLMILLIAAASILIAVVLVVGAHEFSMVLHSASGKLGELKGSAAVPVNMSWVAIVLIINGVNVIFGDRYVRDLSFMILLSATVTWACQLAPIPGRAVFLFLIDLIFFVALSAYISLLRPPSWILVVSAWSLLGAIVHAVSEYDPNISSTAGFLSSSFWYLASSLVLLAVTLRRLAPTWKRPAVAP